MSTGYVKKLIDAALLQEGVEAVSYSIEHPGDLAHGDYATNVALIAGKKLSVHPLQLAEKMAETMRAQLPREVQRVSVAGPGFINFHLAPSFFVEAVEEIVTTPDGWGRNTSLKGKKVIAEYTDPNPFKEMHIGHLMSNTIGESLSRLTEFSGAEVKRVTYQGDVGPHIAKAIWGIKKLNVEPTAQHLGKAYAAGNTAYESDASAKDEIDALNRALYQGTDSELMKLYTEGRDASLQAFEKMYKKLGSSFDRFFFESESAKEGLRLVEEGLKKGIFEMSDGAVVYRGEKKGLHTRVFRTSQGTPTYEAKELGLEPLKQEWWPHDLSIIMTANEQKEYFKVVLAALAEVLPEDAVRIRHVSHGFLRLPEGKMSSRTGNVIAASTLIGDVEKSAREKTDDPVLAEMVAVGAIKYEILKQKSGADIVFDVKKSLSLEGDSGPYLQYAHTRALSVLKKAEAEGLKPATLVVSEEVPELARLLYRFPEVVERAEREREPHYVTTYVTELAGVFNSWYAQEKIVDAGDQYSPYKIALTHAFAITMKNGLWLLGIKAPEKM